MSLAMAWLLRVSSANAEAMIRILCMKLIHRVLSKLCHKGLCYVASPLIVRKFEYITIEDVGKTLGICRLFVEISFAICTCIRLHAV